MSEEALQACVDRHLEHAAFVFMLDDELGTHHGLSWADFVLLTVLDAAGGAAPATELARTLRMRASHLLLRLLPLEKTGLVERIAGHGRGRLRTLMSPRRPRIVKRAGPGTCGRLCQRPSNRCQLGVVSPWAHSRSTSTRARCPAPVRAGWR